MLDLTKLRETRWARSGSSSDRDHYVVYSDKAVTNDYR